MHRSEGSLVTLGCCKSLLWNRHFLNLRILHAFARHNRNTKMMFSSVFPKFSNDKMTLCNNNDQTIQYNKAICIVYCTVYCNNNDQTWFSDTLTSARPLAGR